MKTRRRSARFAVCASRFVFSVLAATVLYLTAGAVSDAQTAPESTPASSAVSPSPVPSPAAQNSASPETSPSPQSSATPTESPLYQVNDDIFTIDRDGTLYYYFQGNTDGTAKVKSEIRYGRNLWNDNAQLRIRIPVITKYPLVGNPYSGLGNIELGYSYNVTSKTFDHSLELRGSFATAANNVSSNDTQLKGFYTTKWKWNGGSIAYTNEYDQSIIIPPGSSYTSYYEGKLTLPEYSFKALRGLKFSAFYNYRVLFDSGGIFKDALGGTLFGNMNDVALSITDSWGLGGHALWKYKFEANATARF
jgi:hypothetical protein